MSERVDIGIIGGSGLYQMDGFTDLQEVRVETPFGPPSDALMVGNLEGNRVAFLPRHGRGHVHTPTTVPYRANIDALKRLGVTDVISVSACGSFREDMAPGDFVIVDQFIDKTFRRQNTFFDGYGAVHCEMAQPTCGRLREALLRTADPMDIKIHTKGTYVCMEGPQFSTRIRASLPTSSALCASNPPTTRPPPPDSSTPLTRGSTAGCRTTSPSMIAAIRR